MAPNTSEKAEPHKSTKTLKRLVTQSIHILQVWQADSQYDARGKGDTLKWDP